MTWEIKSARDAFSAFAPEWDRLNAELYGGHPLFDSRFVLPLLEFFGNGSERLCIHRTSTATDGALILRPLGWGRWALFLPAQAQAGPVLLADPRLLETLMPALPGFAWSIDLLALDPDFCPDWRSLRLPQAMAQHAVTMAVATDGGFEDYWQARPRHLASNMRRYLRRSQEALGTTSLVLVTETNRIREAVTRYGALEMAGWKGKAGTAVDIDNVQGNFYEKTLRDFAATGEAKVAELHIGGKIAASRLIILHKQMWVMLKTTYDESLAAMAPGRQLLHETLREAFSELHSGKVEFYTNATRDQAEWATSLRCISHRQLMRNDVFGVAYAIASAMRNALRMSPSKPADDTATTFTPRRIEQYQDTQDLSPAEIQLIDDGARQNVELSRAWFDNLQHAVFTNDPGVRYYVTESNGSPSAVLPVRLTRRGLIRQIESLANYYTSLYSPLLSPKATALDLAPLLDVANRDHGGAHVMRFSPLDPDSPAYAGLLTALRSNGWIPFPFFCFGNRYLKVEKTWPEYLRDREGSLRNTIKRMKKKFSAEDGTLEIVTDPDSAEHAIQAFNDVYSLSWKKPEPYPDFIPGLIRWLAAEGKLRLGIARLAGRPIASQLWFVSHGKASIFKLAFDPAYAVFSPGTLLTAHLMEHVTDRDGVKEVDFLIGDDDYKKLWMSHRRERWGIVAYNPRTLIGLALLVREVLGRALHGRSKSDNLAWHFSPAADFDTLAPKWQALCDSTIRSPLLSADFVGTALRHFGRGDELVCIAEGPDGPVAGAILQRKNALVWQTFQPSQMPLGPWLQPAGMDFAAVSQSLLRHLPWPAMVLAVTQQDPDFHARPEDDKVVVLDSITTGRTALAPDMEQFMRSGSIKKNPKLLSGLMRRMRKAENEHGKITLEKATISETAGEFVSQYAETESRGWKGLAGTALAPDDTQSKFYAELMQRFANRGAARMYTLKFGDTPVARQIALAGDSVLILLKTTYEPEFRSLGPGVILQYRLIEDAHQTEPALKIIELYGPFNDSQKLWVSGTRTIYHANVYRSRLMAGIHRWWMDARKRSDLASRSVQQQAE